MAMNKKGRPAKSDEYKLLERRTRIARMYCEGNTILEIAKSEDMSISAVGRDLQAIRLFWLSSIVTDMDQKVADLLGRNDHIEATAWRAWERSCKNAETITRSRDKGIKILPPKKKGRPPTAKMVVTAEKLEKVTKGQAGDPRFLQIIGDCLDRRAKYLGIDEGDRNTTNVYLDFSSLLKEQKQNIDPTDIVEQRIQEAKQGTPQIGLKELAEQTESNGHTESNSHNGQQESNNEGSDN